MATGKPKPKNKNFLDDDCVAYCVIDALDDMGTNHRALHLRLSLSHTPNAGLTLYLNFPNALLHVHAHTCADKYIVRAKDMEAFLALRSESTGQTLLLTAVQEASVDCTDRLIECGADVNAIGKRGYTPLLWCCAVGYPNHLVIAKRLFEEEDVDVRIIRCVRACVHAFTKAA